MIINSVEKCVFAVLLLAFFQIPTLADQYLQYLTGYLNSLEVQVSEMKLNAERYEYSNVYAMIEDFKQNPTPAVRTDAELKEKTLKDYEDLNTGVFLFKSNNLIEKTAYMLTPERWPILKNVVENFQPGIPLNPSHMLYSLAVAIILSGLLLWPLRKVFKRQK